MSITNHHPEAEVDALFTRVAPHYDQLNDVISLGIQREWRRRFYQHLPAVTGGNCLDLCCGTCDLTIALAKRVGPRGQVTGLDFNRAMLDRGAAKVHRAGKSREVRLVVGDAMKPPFAPASFDLITIGFGLRNVPDADQVLRAARRLLKPGGTFACLEMSQPTNRLVRLGRRGYFALFPLLARLAGGGLQDYRYLRETANQFMPAAELSRRMRAAGMVDVRSWSLTMGTAAVHVGKAPKTIRKKLQI